MILQLSRLIPLPQEKKEKRRKEKERKKKKLQSSTLNGFIIFFLPGRDVETLVLMKLLMRSAVYFYGLE